jgi:anti-sigma regulatory factor (Ser/Thr protein kinase)
MTSRSELRLTAPAEPQQARPLRHAVAAFLDALGITGDLQDSILTAVGEAVANSVEHAYSGRAPNVVELHVHFVNPTTLAVDVTDYGTFIDREERAGRSYGLRIVRAVAQSVTIDSSNGTQLRMQFDLGR